MVTLWYNINEVSLTQLGEYHTFNMGVIGSSPIRNTKWGKSFNGRTEDCGSSNQGSIPCLPPIIGSLAELVDCNGLENRRAFFKMSHRFESYSFR